MPVSLPGLHPSKDLLSLSALLLKIFVFTKNNVLLHWKEADK